MRCLPCHHTAVWENEICGDLWYVTGLLRQILPICPLGSNKNNKRDILPEQATRHEDNSCNTWQEAWTTMLYCWTVNVVLGCEKWFWCFFSPLKGPQTFLSLFSFAPRLPSPLIHNTLFTLRKRRFDSISFIFIALWHPTVCPLRCDL